ncbi:MULTISPECIES: endonuclease [Mycolicibacterium]|uniref:endonuclease n=1 Tax=Mycolicibacterium TaxID=1866885 RepID=UPI00093C57A3|nr:endonuclease [Mycolicibacterium mageritense]OKH77751.1 endonuclease [Mycobacterium sp. SWH-M3]TXI56700.1 MAG: endonuclease [Mycolicibacterium mageritense]
MSKEDLVSRLLDAAGMTYATEAGIHLKDKPMPLFELLTLCMLASKPIDAGIATQAARELFRCGWRTPQAALDAERRDVIRAFGRAHYARYDESSATRLVAIATAVRDEYHGDLRQLARRSEHDRGAAKRLLMRFKGIGSTGADIFLREVQDTWTWVRPYFDDRALGMARELGLPDEPDRLAALAPHDAARLAAALVRTALDDDLRDELKRQPASA